MALYFDSRPNASSLSRRALAALLMLCLSSLTDATQLQTCNQVRPCEVGCCSRDGLCGFGKNFCSPEQCLDNCDQKADCDPGGFGEDWVKWEKCPLNACCSSQGFCGMGKEFCSQDVASQPVCKDGTKESFRVVGYYDDSTIHGACRGRVYPESIPRGVYSHLNFANAVICPKTFELQPSDKTDIRLYDRLNILKWTDPNLKTYISVGGRKFTDHDRSKATFSEVVRNTTNMDKFISSAIKFLQAYEFDGIDLDWQFPGDQDRGGRDEDFRNFPIFVKRLRNALRMIGRDSITMKLPIAYRHLLHFDLEKLEPQVDFFNVMAYDLHGTWDQGEEWSGPHLKAHNNLTELSRSLDIFWHNDIPPSKVVFGIAFHNRAFTLADPSCDKPGCEYVSYAPYKPCSGELGTLYHNELADIIDKTAWHGVNSVLHVDAAVKTLVYEERYWVSYDDEETIQMRSDFAQSQCLGGVMVSAISQDTPQGRFSMAVDRAAKRSPAQAWSLADGWQAREVRRSEADDEFDYYLGLFLRDPLCVDADDNQGLIYAAQQVIQDRVSQLLYGTPDISTVRIWDERMGLAFSHLKSVDLRNWASSSPAAIRLGSQKLPRRITCGTTTFNKLVGGHETLQCRSWGAR